MKVLLVDDQPDILKIGRISLEKIGKCEVATADSAEAAIAAARASRPDVILMDMMMPDHDGIWALNEIRRSSDLAAVPVIFLTAKTQASEVAQYIQLGAAGVIEKPFDPVGLTGEIKKILATPRS